MQVFAVQIKSSLFSQHHMILIIKTLQEVALGGTDRKRKLDFVH